MNGSVTKMHKVREINEQDFNIYYGPGMGCVLPALIRPDICGTSLQEKHTIDTVGAILLGKFMAQIKSKHHISLLEHLFFGSVIHCFLTL